MTGLDVIIRTMASAARGSTLLRAIDSLTRQQGVLVRPIVVVNGGCRDPQVMAALRRRRDIALIEIEGGLNDASRAGREAVSTACFAFLDDDDEYLPGSAALRVAALRDDPSADLAVGNGIFQPLAAPAYPIIADVAAARIDPWASLGQTNWLASCGGTFRTSAFPVQWFTDLPQFEWTWLAYRSLLERRIVFIDALTYVIHDTPCSASKSEAMDLAQMTLARKLLTLDLPPQERLKVVRRASSFLHSLSESNLRQGRRWAAALYHLRSVTAPGGWRYLPYTRHLILR
jgi:glycosyltransferase involved in cell wall biosynthesis